MTFLLSSPFFLLLLNALWASASALLGHTGNPSRRHLSTWKRDSTPRWLDRSLYVSSQTSNNHNNPTDIGTTVAPLLPVDDNLRRTFALIDKNGDGTLDFSELKASLRACGRAPSDEELYENLKEAGHDPDNLALDFAAFKSLHGNSNTISLTDVRMYFESFDVDITGYLSAAELRRTMTNMNLAKDDSVVEEMISMYDLDGNGQIDFYEFVELIEALGFDINNDGEDADCEETVSVDDDPCQIDLDDESPRLPIEDFPEPMQNIMKQFDYNNCGTVSATDLQRAAELLKVEKMAGVKDPEANPSLHWKVGREKRGLGDVVYKANHIALIVSDIGRSAAFYSDIMGFQQIRRPNFDRHGAWFTMGNLELHLIKGTPLVHSGDDLIVGHISIETYDIDRVPGMLRKMNVPFRQNVSVPKGTDAGSMGTNDDNNSAKIVRQYFFRDPDGYYIEVCNCDVVTKYCLGERNDLANYEEGAPKMTFSDAGNLIGLMQKWTTTGEHDLSDIELLVESGRARDAAGSIERLAELLGRTSPAASAVDKEKLAGLVTRMSVYGDICQNETKESIKEILLAAGNDAPLATKIMRLRARLAGEQRLQPPAFYEEGELFFKPNSTSL